VKPGVGVIALLYYNSIMIPKITEERKLWKKGYRFVACIDEAGRGPLAGPVVAAAVCLSLAKDSLARLRMKFPRLRDSKKLSAKRREEIYTKVIHHPSIQWGIGIVSEKIIDQINIFQATRLAMEKAVADLQEKTSVDFLIVDGNMKLRKVSTPQKAIVKGDEKVFSCALASIIAKVTRDRMMVHYHKKYPQYGFNKHKGYGTKLHISMLSRYGSCAIHRMSFHPVQSCKRKRNLVE
jgi:ribonuclease HII